MYRAVYVSCTEVNRNAMRNVFTDDFPDWRLYSCAYPSEAFRLISVTRPQLIIASSQNYGTSDKGPEMGKWLSTHMLWFELLRRHLCDRKPLCVALDCGEEAWPNARRRRAQHEECGADLFYMYPYDVTTMRAIVTAAKERADERPTIPRINPLDFIHFDDAGRVIE